MNSVAVNIGGQVSEPLFFNSLGHIPRSGVAGSCDSSKFSFQRSSQTVFLELFLRAVKLVTGV